MHLYFICASSGLKKRSVVLYMSILSIVTPIGVLIGIIVTVHMEQVSIVYFCILVFLYFYLFVFLYFSVFVVFVFLYFCMIKMLRRPEELMCWQSGCCKAWQQAPFSTSPSMRSLCRQHYKNQHITDLFRKCFISIIYLHHLVFRVTFILFCDLDSQVLARDKLSRYGMGGLVGSLAVLAGFLLMAGLEAAGGGHR